MAGWVGGAGVEADAAMAPKIPCSVCTLWSMPAAWWLRLSSALLMAARVARSGKPPAAGGAAPDAAPPAGGRCAPCTLVGLWGPCAGALWGESAREALCGVPLGERTRVCESASSAG
eukprot:TRINITY_DN10293_c0_g1_i2.p3 TRINITY_DN10293_c0_g1~~TRINITY_DN10293_c0_g1_i2.p3  ORF type:complete len:117 (-),score=1.74 TRINITY_DN10293_c0_g1_i2:977-1327(-)